MLAAAVAVLSMILPLSGECTTCKGEGVLPCTRHRRRDAEMEAGVLYCSVVSSCRDCRGLLVRDCPRCDAGDRDIERRLARRAPIEAEAREAWERFGHRFPVGRSEHFLLFWDGDAVTADGRRRNEHSALHLYLERLEGMMDEFCEATGATEDDFSTVFHVMVWKSARDNRKASEIYTNQPNPNVTGTKRMGAVGIYTVHIDPAYVDPDESASADLHRAIRHNVAHLLLANCWDGRWPGQLGGGWVDAGLAHWFEDRLDRRCTYFCYREQDTVASFKGGWWRAPVRKMIRRRDRPSFPEVASKNTTELTLEEHALAWSYVEFLISRDPEGFGAICRSIKAGKGWRDVMRERFGWTPFQFEEEWKRHVLETYTSRR